MSTTIVLMAGGYREVVCLDPWLSPAERHYVIRRTVDYASICLQ